MIPEFKSIQDLLNRFPDEATCITHLEQLRWDGFVVSPFDAESKVYVCAGHKYKCKNTGKYFNVRTGTIFEDTKLPLQKWFLALYIFSSHKKGISSHQLAKDLDITQKSAWFVLHRLRYAFDHPNFKEVLGQIDVVEIDETYIGGDEKNKHFAKKTPNSQGRSTKSKTPLLGMMERGGNIQTQVVANTKGNTINPIIAQSVMKGAVVSTDEWRAYNSLSTRFSHVRVNHSAKEYVSGIASTNNVECFWSHLKRGIDGIYHWVSVKHLQSYADEFSLRYNSRKFGTAERFNFVLENVEGRLKYKTLIDNE